MTEACLFEILPRSRNGRGFFLVTPYAPFTVGKGAVCMEMK
jgi:hypothetical protein